MEDGVADGPMAEERGDSGGLRSSLPSIEEIDMPGFGRWVAKLAKSRTPANGDVVGGPRGAEAR